MEKIHRIKVMIMMMIMMMMMVMAMATMVTMKMTMPTMVIRLCVRMDDQRSYSDQKVVELRRLS